MPRNQSNPLSTYRETRVHQINNYLTTKTNEGTAAQPTEPLLYTPCNPKVTEHNYCTNFKKTDQKFGSQERRFPRHPKSISAHDCTSAIRAAQMWLFTFSENIVLSAQCKKISPYYCFAQYSTTTPVFTNVPSHSTVLGGISRAPTVTPIQSMLSYYCTLVFTTVTPLPYLKESLARVLVVLLHGQYATTIPLSYSIHSSYRT